MSTQKNLFQSVAEHLQLGFVHEMPWQSLPYADRFQLFRRGICLPVQSLLHGIVNGAQVFVFQQRYRIESSAGYNDSFHAQTVAMFQSPDLNLPMFELKPKSFKHRLGSMFSASVDFSNHPTFAAQYLVSGADATAIRRVFNQELIAALEANSGWAIEGGGGQFFMYRENYIAPPEQIQWLIETGQRLLGLLKAKETSS